MSLDTWKRLNRRVKPCKRLIKQISLLFLLHFPTKKAFLYFRHFRHLRRENPRLLGGRYISIVTDKAPATWHRANAHGRTWLYISAPPIHSRKQTGVLSFGLSLFFIACHCYVTAQNSPLEPKKQAISRLFGVVTVVTANRRIPYI